MKTRIRVESYLEALPDVVCGTLEKAQNCIDEFLSNQKKKHTTATYIKYP